MSKKNLLSGRDKELQELAEQYEAAKAENKPIYLDADDLADLADWYAMRRLRKWKLSITRNARKKAATTSSSVVNYG